MLKRFSRLDWRTAILIPLLLFGFALALRCWGIDNNLPYGQRPDESSDIAESLNLLRGQPPTYAYHRVAWPLTQIPLQGLDFLYHRLTQPSFNVAAFEALYFTDRAVFVLSTRIYLALWTALACVLLYFAGRLLTGTTLGGLLTGGLLALMPPITYLSHIALPDAYATFWITVTLLGALLMLQKRTKWAYALAGFGAGVTILARLQALPLVILMVVAAHLIVWWQTPERPARLLLGRWLWAFGAFVLAHAIFNPYLFLHPAAALADLGFIFSERYTGTYYHPQSIFQPLANVRDNWLLPILFLRPYVILPAAVISLWAARRSAFVFGIAAATWVFIASIMLTSAPRITYWLPAAVPFCLILGWGVWQALQTHARLIKGVALIAAVLIGAAALLETIKIDTVLAQPSTQTLAANFISANIPANTRILQGDPFIYSVPLSRSLESIKRLPPSADLTFSYQYALDHPALVRAPAYDLFTTEYAPQLVSDDAMRAFLAQNQIDAVIQVDYCGGKASYAAGGTNSFPAVTDAVRQDLTLIFTASPFSSDTCAQQIADRTDMETMNLWDWQRTGPIIHVYRVNR
ncbi:MAG: hypothetical protein ABI700_08835 [Chloroflexota bacterium]